MLGNHFLTLSDLQAQDLTELIQLARYLKARRTKGVIEDVLRGKTLAMIFEKPSLRTRVSFECAMQELGGASLYLSHEEVGIGKRETADDVARVLGRYVHGIMARTFKHQTVCDLAQYAGVPVINGLSDLEHPCQALADFLTIQEHLGSLKDRTIVFIGDGNNVARSLAHCAILAQARLILASPAAYAFTKDDQRAFGAHWGTAVSQTTDIRAAAKGADVLYTDVWTSMGQEAERAQRLKDFQGYQINSELIALAGPQVRVMHCLPAHRGEEITGEAMECPASIVFDQAENRLHAQKAVLRLLMAKDRFEVLAAAKGKQ